MTASLLRDYPHAMGSLTSCERLRSHSLLSFLYSHLCLCSGERDHPRASKEKYERSQPADKLSFTYCGGMVHTQQHVNAALTTNLVYMSILFLLRRTHWWRCEHYTICNSGERNTTKTWPLCGGRNEEVGVLSDAAPPIAPPGTKPAAETTTRPP